MAFPRSPFYPENNHLYINNEPIDRVLNHNLHGYRQQAYEHYYNTQPPIWGPIKKEHDTEDSRGNSENKLTSCNSSSNSYCSNNSLDVNVTTSHETIRETNTDRNDQSVKSLTDQSANNVAIMVNDEEDADDLLVVVYSEQAGKEDKKEKILKKKYKCTYCPKSFETINLRKQHESSDHTGAQLHKCSHCNMFFGTKYRKKVHELRHGSDCPYICSLCGDGFKSLYKRQVHEKCHLDQQPHHCQYCGEKFPTQYKKNRHEIGHISNTPYECRYCDESFKSQYRCRQHELAHSSDKPYQCQFCNESFKSSHKRYIHILSHSGLSNPYQCPKCVDKSSAFRTPYKLRAHLAAIHRLKPTEIRELVQLSSERDAVILASTSANNAANVTRLQTDTYRNAGNSSPNMNYLRRMQDDEIVTCFSCNAQFSNKLGLISHIRAHHTFTFL